MNQYDAIIIGAGMSGLAAGIRLAMFDKKVCILEKHKITGGLNSYYKRKNKEKDLIYEFDVGLHALTNFIDKGEKGKPFSKLLKQLRLRYDDFKLHPQSYSLIKFAQDELKFTNDFEVLRAEVHEKFPSEKDHFEKLVKEIQEFDELNLDLKQTSTKQKLSQIIKNDLLNEMLLAPCLIYGSAWEHDMDFAQFVVMFKSLYFEGFSRPEGGVRTILNLLVEKFESLGGEIHFKTPVEKILTQDKKIVGVKTTKGDYQTSHVFSSMGLPETLERVGEKNKAPVGKMSFTETILVLDKKIENFDPTIIFYNQGHKYQYRKPDSLFDDTSAVVCCPDNYESQIQGNGCLRVTYMANYEKWKAMERAEYLEQKQRVFESSLSLIRKLIPNFNREILIKDVFTPTTIERYTWHKKGTVYGSPDKTRKGLTNYKGLYIIGTDQGFLGIVGSMLSGISMANLHGLMNEV